MNDTTATYDERLSLVTIETKQGTAFLTPNETYRLYLALSAILSQLPQPLSRDLP